MTYDEIAFGEAGSERKTQAIGSLSEPLTGIQTGNKIGLVSGQAPLPRGIFGMKVDVPLASMVTEFRGGDDQVVGVNSFSLIVTATPFHSTLGAPNANTSLLRRESYYENLYHC